MNMQVTQDVLDALKSARQVPNDDLAKNFTQSSSAISGITAYDLEGPAKLLFPVLTPLRNKIPRVVGGMGIQANWRAVTGVDTSNAGVGVSEGNRGAVMGQTTKDYIAAFKGLGMDNNVTFEADFAAKGFDDVKALAVRTLLEALMIGEEKVILGGNTSTALGTAGTPTVADVPASVGTLAYNTAYSTIIVALTLDAYLNANQSTTAPALPLSGNRTLADGTIEAYNRGTSIKSTNASVTTSNDTLNTHSITASWAVTPGAVAYAVFFGPAGSEKLNQIVTINSAKITAVSAAGAQAAAANFTVDNSQNSLVFDGILTQIQASGSGAYVATQATGTAGSGTGLTADTAGGIVEFNAALKSFWDNYRISPDEIWVASQEQTNIQKKVLNGTTSTAQRFVFNVDQQNIIGGTSVEAYTNPYSIDGNNTIPIKLHPFLPAGTVLFWTDKLPYPLSNVTNVVRMLLRRDYYQIEWPQLRRKYEYGVYMDGVLQNYFPPSFGVITNIGNN